MYESLSLNRLMKELQQIFEEFPDLRTGQNTQYEVSDAGKGAFSVFFTQSASFFPKGIGTMWNIRKRCKG